jgi:hypothetical protein
MPLHRADVRVRRDASRISALVVKGGTVKESCHRREKSCSVPPNVNDCRLPLMIRGFNGTGNDVAELRSGGPSNTGQIAGQAAQPRGEVLFGIGRHAQKPFRRS